MDDEISERGPITVAVTSEGFENDSGGNDSTSCLGGSVESHDLGCGDGATSCLGGGGDSVESHDLGCDLHSFIRTSFGIQQNNEWMVRIRGLAGETPAPPPLPLRSAPRQAIDTV